MAKRKKINPRVLLVICVLGVILAGFIVAVIIQRLPKDPTADIQYVDQEVQKERPNWPEVFRHLGRAIANSEKPQSTDLLYRKAELHFDVLQREPNLTRVQQQEHQQSGWQTLETVIRKDNRHLKARRFLTRLYAAQAVSNPKNTKAWQDYIDQINGILSVDPKDAGAYSDRARAYAQLALIDPQYQTNAIEDIRKAIELDKTNVAYQDFLCRYLLTIGKITEAEQAFREAIQAHPNKAQLYVSYAGLLRQQNRLDEAKQQVEKAVQNDPSSPLGYLDQSRELLRKKQYDQAEAVLNKAQKIADTDIRVYAQYILLYRLKNDRQAAVRVLREGLAALKKEDAEAEDDDKLGARRRSRIRATLNYMLADVLLDLYATSTDEKEKEKLLDEAKERYQILVTLSSSQMQKDHIAGRIAYDEENWAKARELLERVVDNDPTSRVAVMLLNVYRRLGIPGQSEKLAERVLQMRNLSRPGQILFCLELAQLHIHAGELEKAEKRIRAAAALDPDHEGVKQMQEALAAYRGQTGTVFSGNHKVGGMTRAGLFQSVQNLMLDEQYDEAKTILEKMVRQDPTDLQALSRLAALLLEREERDEALEWIAKAQLKAPENENLKRLEAMIREPSADKRYDIEIGFIDRTKTENPLVKALQKWSIASRYGKTNDAEAFLEEAEKIAPNNNTVISIRFREALLKKDWTAAEKLIARVQEDEAGTFRGLQHARLAMAQGRADTLDGKTDPAREKFQKALSYLQSIEKVAPHLPVPHLLMAECYRELGKVDDAKKQYKICYDNNPRDLQALIGLAQLAQQAEQTNEHHRWIEEAYKLPSGKIHPYILEQHLQILEADPRNIHEILQQRERILKRNPGNLNNAFRLAGLYEKTEQINRAQEMIEYIYTRTPNKLSIAPMLADLYLRMNRPAKADEMFSELLKTAKDKTQKVLAQIAYADFLAKTDEAAALRMYEKAHTEEGDKGIVALQAMSNFRAAQARLETTRGRKDQAKVRWEESIRLLEKALHREPDNRALKLMLLQRYVESGRDEKAVAGYRELIQTDPRDIDARLGLGSTYLQNDQLDQAREQFDEVIRINPDIAEPYLLRSRVYQSQMELAKAAADINNAASLTGNNSLKMDLARLYEAMGDAQQAARTYDAMITQNPEDFAAYNRLLNLFFQEKRWSALDALARKGMRVFPQSPGFALMLASAAEAQGNTNDQLHWLERAAQTAPDNARIMRTYWTTLLKHQEYSRLQREIRKSGNQPAQAFGAKAVEIAARAKQNPGSAKTFREFLSLLQSAKSPYDVFFVGQVLKEAYGAETVANKGSEIRKARPNDKNVLLFVGDASLQEKKYTEAERDYQEALKLCKTPGEKTSLYLRLAQLYAQQQAYPKAEAQYRAILKDNPNNIIALNNLAYTCIDHLNRPDEGLKLIQRAMKITPGDPNLVDTYAWALAKLGRFQESRDMLEKVIGIGNAAESPDQLYHMGYVLEKTGSSRQADRYYRQALEIARAKKNTELQKAIEAAMEKSRQK